LLILEQAKGEKLQGRMMNKVPKPIGMSFQICHLYSFLFFGL